MSGEAETGGLEEAAKPGPGAPEPVKPRRGILGYKRSDVDRMLAERDALLAETRQDVAALWLAFAQHDRMIREGLMSSRAEVDAGRAPPASPPRAPAPPPAAPAPPPAPEPVSPTPGETASVDQQLSDLDEVLAAIEAATQTLERAYADEIAPEPQEGAPEDPAGDQPAGTEPGSSSPSSASSPA